MRAIAEDYRADRTDWDEGPWDDEPDLLRWTEPETGYPCTALRHWFAGHWLGYVDVPENSMLAGAGLRDRIYVPPNWEGKQFTLREIGFFNLLAEALEEEGKKGKPIAVLLAVYGGLSYSEGTTFGFDCGHPDDLSPGVSAALKTLPPHHKQAIEQHQTYRTLEFVKNECNQLAWQLKELNDALSALVRERLATET